MFFSLCSYKQLGSDDLYLDERYEHYFGTLPIILGLNTLKLTIEGNLRSIVVRWAVHHRF